MIEEIWEDVVGYDGLYQVNNYGVVKSLSRYVKSSNSVLSLKKERLLKSSIYGDYLGVTLCKNGLIKKMLVLKFTISTANREVSKKEKPTPVRGLFPIISLRSPYNGIGSVS